MINAIAVDDEPLALTVLEVFCGKVSDIKLEKVFTDPKEALKHLRKFPVDLIFLDIKMPAMTGFDLQKNISQESMIIFTTAYTEYAAQSYELNTIDYLVKPFEFSRFEKAVKRAKDYYRYIRQSDQIEKDHFYVRADYSLHKIAFNNLHFIEGLDSYVKIHLYEGKTILARVSMKAILEKLPPTHFVRVHRSFIVPVARITAIRNKTIYLDKTEIPIGSNYSHIIDQLSGSR
jgi:DNA-binding LytR/AlgR family response regulator